MDNNIEQQYREQGYRVICGVDEAGRGPLAGCVTAAACILPEGITIERLNDSKKLSPKRREELFGIITEKAVAYSVASVDVEEIERVNILNAALHAMRLAIDSLSVKPDAALIDGCISRDFELPAFAIVGGDGKVPSIAAASILAKVTRDRYMLALDEKYPQYGFARHKGYGTAEHIAAIRRYGACPEHRMSFIGKFIG